MNSYLEVAELVLRRVRRPLTSIEILRAAYELGIAPAHLRGRTQHKTMGARLSEDILQLRDESRFYRTAPGRFMLKELQQDGSIPAEFRRPIVARRRRRALPAERSLAFSSTSLASHITSEGTVSCDAVLNLIDQSLYYYSSNSRNRITSDFIAWSFALVIRSGHILTYRQGSFREDRDTFVRRRTIGFYAPVIDDDLTLFDRTDHGIVSSSVRALATDLDLHGHFMWDIVAKSSRLVAFVVPSSQAINDLLAVVAFSCPEWLEPTSKRLAINDLEWLDLRVPLNHLEDFDPWSQAVIAKVYEIGLAKS